MDTVIWGTTTEEAQGVRSGSGSRGMDGRGSVRQLCFLSLHKVSQTSGDDDANDDADDFWRCSEVTVHASVHLAGAHGFAGGG